MQAYRLPANRDDWKKMLIYSLGSDAFVRLSILAARETAAIPANAALLVESNQGRFWLTPEEFKENQAGCYDLADIGNGQQAWQGTTAQLPKDRPNRFFPNQ